MYVAFKQFTATFWHDRLILNIMSHICKFASAHKYRDNYTLLVV